MAKYLTDRHEIAMAINFGNYPVLTINRENLYDKDYPGYAIGCRCRVAWDRPEKRYEGMTTHGNVYFCDGKVKISAEGCCLSSSFGYHDVMRMTQEAHAPIVHKGQTVVLVEEWPSKKICTVRMMKVSDRIDTLCQTVAHLEDLE